MHVEFFLFLIFQEKMYTKNKEMEEREAEIELMQAAFSDSFHLIEHNTECSRFSITIDQVLDNSVQSATVVTDIFITLPQSFPEQTLSCYVDGKYTNSIVYSVNSAIQSQLNEVSDIRSMELCQLVQDVVAQQHENTNDNKALQYSKINILPEKVVIARFLIYFHHIMSTAKRKAIVDNAKELRLGGVSKTGFPGIVVVEGALEDVLEYVRRIQRLRWQQMVVRGEEMEDIDLSSAGRDRDHSSSGSRSMNDERFHTQEVSSSSSLSGSIVQRIEQIVNTHRKISTDFYELYCAGDSGNGGMSEVSNFCKSVGLHDLFMTALKKYGGSS